MDQKVLDFLSTERVCSLARVMPDGSCHSMAMHFCFDPHQNAIHFLTAKSSQKCQDLSDNKVVPASAAVGFSEENMITLQLDGSLRLAAPADLLTVKNVYFAKFPDSRKYDSPDSAYLVFHISSWKYMNHKTDEIIKG